MEKYIKLATFIVGLLVTLAFVGCEKSDSENTFGYSQIFIPQSTVSGGQNQHYLVPTGANKDTYNFKVDTLGNKVNIMLGVSRSGLEAYDAYSVNIVTQADTINTLIANGGINTIASAIPVQLLPETAYTLPTSVSVPAGKYSASFYLEIKLDVLKTYVGQKVALCVAITNPTKYVLSSTNSKVVILIEVDKLKLP